MNQGRSSLLRVFSLYAVSGFVSLGYQVAWFRIFTGWFGSTNLTFALVVCNFIGGLSLGAILSERLTTLLERRLHLTDRLRIYGALELCVGTTVLLTLLAEQVPADLWGVFPYDLRGEIWVQTASYRLSQVGLAAACVLVPCIFMGATFPLLCNVFVGEPRGNRFPAALYAWNTLGACVGVLACQFVFFLWLGHERTFWLMAGMNLLLGLYFLVSGGAPRSSDEAHAEPVPASAADPATAGSGVLLTFALLSGFLAGALEGDLFKRISFLIQVSPGATMSFISFWAILGIFLASVLVYRSARLTLAVIKLCFVAALAYYLVAWQLRDLIIYPTLFHSTPAHLLFFTGIYVFPPFFLISFLLPYTCNLLQTRRQHLGLAYGLNTVAFCVGLIGFSLIAPKVNIFFSLKLFMVTLALGTLLLIFLSEARPLSLWKPLVALAGFAVALLVTPADFDRDYFLPDSHPATKPITAVKSNGADTTFVAGGTNLYFGRLPMSATAYKAQVYQRLMAHFPLLAHPKPEKALLICFGVGNTASAIAAHDSIVRIDAVDLNDNVFETAPEFAESNLEVFRDSRLRMIHDDGRDFLTRTDETYDLITSEPPPPLAAGAYRLYSREFYQAALDHLSPEGLMSQWLPMGQLPERAQNLAVRTFLDAFPHTLLLMGYGKDLILVGSQAPIDLERLTQRFSESQGVVEDLARIHVLEPADLHKRIMLTDEKLRFYYQTGRLLSDQRNDFEHILGS